MKRIGRLAGWLAALTATACAAWFFLEGRQLKEALGAIRGQTALLEQSLEKARAELKEWKARSAAAAGQAKMDETKPPGSTGLFESAMNMVMDSAQSGAEKKVDVAGLVKGLMKANGTGGGSGILSLFEGPGGEQMTSMSAQFLTNMQYDSFINGLQLAPEQKQRVRDILNKYNSQMMRRGLDAVQGKGDITALADETRAWKEQMRAELGTVLGADDLAQFDAYEEEMPGRMVDQSMEMQLGMFAGGLTPENRAMVREVLVQELLAAKPDAAAPQTADGMAAATQVQQAAFERALERLQPSLAPDQYAVVESFVQQQQSIMDMVAGMMPKPAAPAGTAAAMPQQATQNPNGQTANKAFPAERRF